MDWLIPSRLRSLVIAAQDDELIKHCLDIIALVAYDPNARTGSQTWGVPAQQAALTVMQVRPLLTDEDPDSMNLLDACFTARCTAWFWVYASFASRRKLA